MTSLIGWLILAALLCLPGLALLSATLAVARRRHPGVRFPAWAFVAGTAGSGIVLWFVLPLLVWWFLGRHAP